MEESKESSSMMLIESYEASSLSHVSSSYYTFEDVPASVRDNIIEEDEELPE